MAFSTGGAGIWAQGWTAGATATAFPAPSLRPEEFGILAAEAEVLPEVFPRTAERALFPDLLLVSFAMLVVL